MKALVFLITFISFSTMAQEEKKVSNLVEQTKKEVFLKKIKVDGTAKELDLKLKSIFKYDLNRNVLDSSGAGNGGDISQLRHSRSLSREQIEFLLTDGDMVVRKLLIEFALKLKHENEYDFLEERFSTLVSKLSELLHDIKTTKFILAQEQFKKNCLSADSEACTTNLLPGSNIYFNVDNLFNEKVSTELLLGLIFHEFVRHFIGNKDDDLLMADYAYDYFRLEFKRKFIFNDKNNIFTDFNDEIKTLYCGDVVIKPHTYTSITFNRNKYIVLSDHYDSKTKSYTGGFHTCSRLSIDIENDMLMFFTENTKVDKYFDDYFKLNKEITSSIKKVERKHNLECYSISEMGYVNIEELKKQVTSLQPRGCYSSMFGIECLNDNELKSYSKNEIDELEKYKQREISEIKKGLSEISSSISEIYSGQISCYRDTLIPFNNEENPPLTTHKLDLSLDFHLDRDGKILDYSLTIPSKVIKVPYRG